MSLNNGYRLLSERGMIQCFTATVNNLSDGTYYWGVQAIDTAFAGSEFSEESSFTITANPPMFSQIEDQTRPEGTTTISIVFSVRE
jgi:hypothetical protein